MTDTLARICDAKRRHVVDAKRRHPTAEIRERSAAASPPRGFTAALRTARAEGRYGLIAEIKRASPSKGTIRRDFDPAALARAYAAGGAACLSVLTDTPFFQGTDAHLVAARSATALPVLRKDFMLDPYQVLEARAIGADCVLLIVAALGDGQAEELLAAAAESGMDALVEVHDEAELSRALTLDAGTIGINNRNLKTLQTDIGTARRLAPLVPEDRLVVAESGLSTRSDLAAMREAGVTTFLIGEALMREADVRAATEALLGPAGR